MNQSLPSAHTPSKDSQAIKPTARLLPLQGRRTRDPKPRRPGTPTPPRTRAADPRRDREAPRRSQGHRLPARDRRDRPRRSLLHRLPRRLIEPRRTADPLRRPGIRARARRAPGSRTAHRQPRRFARLGVERDRPAAQPAGWAEEVGGAGRGCCEGQDGRDWLPAAARPPAVGLLEGG